MTRLRNVVVLVLTGFASLLWPHNAMADSGVKEAAVAAQKREEILQTQITYACIGAGAVGVAVVIFLGLNAANTRGKALDSRHKRKRPLDPDAPLEYEEPPIETPPTEPEA